MTTAAKLREISDILEVKFGVPERRGQEDPLSTLIRTILSQNTNDANSGRAYRALRQRYPTWQEVLHASEEELAETIRIGGLANQKAATIQRLLGWLEQTSGRLSLDFICNLSVEEAVDRLLPIKGIGLKTIYVTLCFACGHEVFPVDTHILRVSKRLGLVPSRASADQAHTLLNRICPPGKAFPLHVNLIHFGRRICHARQPKCDLCPLFEYCDWVHQR